MVGDLMLAANELVTNAVRHSGGGPRDSVSVEVSFGPDLVLVSVSDPGSAGGRAEPIDDNAQFGGFGLHLVEQLSSRWGSERDAAGRYRVWAEVSTQVQA